MSEVASKLGVTSHKIRRLIKDCIFAAEQVVPGAPYQIRAGHLDDERVTAALGRKGRPYRTEPEEIAPAIRRGIAKTREGIPALLEFITEKAIDVSRFG